MSTTAQICNRKSSVIIYQDTDVKGRQQFTVRTPQGHKLYQCRRVSALIHWLQNNKHTPFVYDELPIRTRNQLDSSRAAARHEVAKQERRFHIPRPTLGNLFPVLHQLKTAQ